MAEDAQAALAALRKFVEESPLWTKDRELFLRIDGVIAYDAFGPRVVNVECATCGIARPFEDTRTRGGGGGRSGSNVRMSLDGIHTLAYRCTDCRSAEFYCWIEINAEEKWIQKVGQTPPWRINPPKDVAAALGEDVVLYSRARVCLNQGYGLGACAYLRRILECHVELFLKFVRESLDRQGGTENLVREIDAALAGKDMSEKARLAMSRLPEALYIDGVNPLKSLHDFVSQPVHALDEETGVRRAMEILAAMEYTITTLAAQRQAKDKFRASIRAIDTERAG